MTIERCVQVENLQALQNFDSIVAAADAVVLSRGNLGLDVAPEKTAVVQKAAINRCNLQGKPVIITRLVDTMVEAPRCTRHAPLSPISPPGPVGWLHRRIQGTRGSPGALQAPVKSPRGCGGHPSTC